MRPILAHYNALWRDVEEQIANRILSRLVTRLWPLHLVHRDPSFREVADRLPPLDVYREFKGPYSSRYVMYKYRSE